MSRRDYGRWEPWMARAILVALILFAIVLFASGEFLLGLVGVAVTLVWLWRPGR